MKLGFISDTHMKHNLLDYYLEDCDVMIHSGDALSSGNCMIELINFKNWVDKIAKNHCKYFIYVAGNHDKILENDPVARKILTETNIIYLNGNGLEINGIKFWGSPIQPYFNNWAFNVKKDIEREFHWAKIPEDTQVLITHCPPYGIRDRVMPHGLNVGCKPLKERLKDLKDLRIHAFGHIHEDSGITTENGVTFINASILDLGYKFNNKPVYINI